MSRVDVIIPCYNYGHFLRECVESVLSQEGVDVRVLIIDDCSADNTPQIASEMAAEDKRIEFRRHEINKGHIATYNEGLLEWADAEYSLLLSADDLLTPGALPRASRLLDTHPEVGMVHGRAITLVDDRPAAVQGPVLSEAYTWQVIAGREFLQAVCATVGNPVATPTAVVRTSLQHRIGGYRADLPHSGDMEMWMRFATHAAVGILHIEQAYYRQHATNMHCRYRRSVLEDLPERRDAFEALFRAYSLLLPDGAWLQGLANQGLATKAFWLAYHAFQEGKVYSCRECLEFAASTFPEVRTWPAWSHLHWKLFIGPRVWAFLRPLVDFLWRPAASSASSTAGQSLPSGPAQDAA